MGTDAVRCRSTDLRALEPRELSKPADEQRNPRLVGGIGLEMSRKLVDEMRLQDQVFDLFANEVDRKSVV